MWYLVVVFIFMGFGGAKRLENVLKSSLGMVKQAIKGKEKVFVGKGVLIM